MTDLSLEGIASMSLHRNGTTSVITTGGRTITSPLPPGTFAESSANGSSSPTGDALVGLDSDKHWESE